jgi:hypothetical protein
MTWAKKVTGFGVTMRPVEPCHTRPYESPVLDSGEDRQVWGVGATMTSMENPRYSDTA